MKAKHKSLNVIKKLMKGNIGFEGSSIYINTQGELALYKCTGLKEYSRERVVLDAVDARIEIKGEELELKTFSTSEICVSGRIENVGMIRVDGEKSNV